MRVLFVASYNKGYFAPFIVEQAKSIEKAGVDVGFFGLEGHGISGYLKSLPSLKKKISEFRPDIIHAHYGLSGLLANLQRRVPVVTTYHGSDINEDKVLRFSKIAMRLSAFNVFVSQKNVDKAGAKKKFALIPCGVNLDNFEMQDKDVAREKVGWDKDAKKVLFAGAFDNAVKNSKLAIEAISKLHGVELVEMKGYTREQVAALMFASDAFLMTSFTEGSPQVVKEAMVCGCPIVSVDVGDVADVTKGVDGCHIAERDADDVAQKLKLALSFNGRTNGLDRIMELGLTNELVANKIIEIYKSVLNDNTER